MESLSLLTGRVVSLCLSTVIKIFNAISVISDYFISQSLTGDGPQVSFSKNNSVELRVASQQHRLKSDTHTRTHAR